ncbi:MAG: hypothetical protein HYZ26_12265 [Chloroflexi bacterium]|nr:hypothetical protein [Chloroflexota bacterium]
MHFGLKILLILTMLSLAIMAFGKPNNPAQAAAGDCQPAETQMDVEAGALTANLLRSAYRLLVRALNLQSEDVVGQGRH